jgi:hypothetical protein
MNTAIAARVADGVTAAYLRDLTRHATPAPGHPRERGHTARVRKAGTTSWVRRPGAVRPARADLSRSPAD